MGCPKDSFPWVHVVLYDEVWQGQEFLGSDGRMCVEKVVKDLAENTQHRANSQVSGTTQTYIWNMQSSRPRPIKCEVDVQR